MKTKKHDTRWMVSVALMAAIVIVLANTPLGMIQLRHSYPLHFHHF